MLEGFGKLSEKAGQTVCEEKSANQQRRHLFDKKLDISLIRGQTENNNIAGTLSYLSFQLESF